MITHGQSASPTLIRFGSHPMIAADFVKRHGQDDLFHAIFTRAEPRTVLTGIRGSGKTQLAAAVAAGCEKEGWPLVAWIHAASRKEIIANLYELALRIGIYAPSNIPLEVIVRRFLDQLRSANESNRLFVFDNVENPDDLRDLIPEGAGVRTIITTTRYLDGEGLGWLRLTVGAFDREQSITLLCERTGDTHREAADRIADALGDVPIAITQAAATAKGGGYTLSGYLDRLSNHPLESRISRLEGDNYPDAVGIALLVAYEQVLEQLSTKHPQQERIAISLLDALSLLGVSGVPTHWLLRLNNNSEDVRNTLSFLRSASIFHESSDGEKAIIHRLQGHVYREIYLRPGEARTSAATVLSGMDVDRLENVEQRRQETRNLIEQLLSVASQDYSHLLYSEPQVSLKLAETLQCATSLEMSQIALTLTESVTQVCDTLGPHHPHTLSPRNELARAYRASGRLDKAIAMYKQILEDSTRILGTDHPSTLASRDDLAAAYRDASRLEEAIPLYERIFDDVMRILGPDDLGILASRLNLADVYRDASRLDDAIAMYKQNLQDSVRILGPHHPRTLASRNHLAGTCRDVGRLDEAIPLYEQYLEDLTRILGPDHPGTLASRHNLAGAYQDAGRLDEAVSLFEQNLDDFTRLLGPDHPDTFTSRSTLAGAYQAAGRLHDTIPLHEQTLTDRARTLGPDHPVTLTSRNNLAGAYQAAGRLNEAITLHRQTLKDSIRSLGPYHPHTLTSRNNLASAYRAAGRNEEAEALFKTPSDSVDEQNGTKDDPDQETSH